MKQSVQLTYLVTKHCSPQIKVAVHELGQLQDIPLLQGLPAARKYQSILVL